MKQARFVTGLTLLNLLLLVLLLSGGWANAVQEPSVTPILRTQVLELVDGRGQVRSRLNVEADGAVMLRLLDQRGTIRVKLGADAQGSGLVLLDEETEPAIHMLARRKGTRERPTTTSITLRAADSPVRVIQP